MLLYNKIILLVYSIRNYFRVRKITGPAPYKKIPTHKGGNSYKSKGAVNFRQRSEWCTANILCIISMLQSFFLIGKENNGEAKLQTMAMKS